MFHQLSTASCLFSLFMMSLIFHIYQKTVCNFVQVLIQQLLRDCTYNANATENNEKLRYLLTKIKIKTWCSQNYIFIFKSYVECCIFLSIYELQLHEKKCIFIIHGSFCPLRFMELNFFWVWNDNSSLVNCLPKGFCYPNY